MKFETSRLKSILRNTYHSFKTDIRVIKQNIGQELDYLKERAALDPEIMRLRLSLLQYSPILSNNLFRIVGGFVIIFSFLASFYLFAWGAPMNFPEHALVTVERGEYLGQIAESFEKAGIVKSSGWLKLFMFVTGGDKRIIAGDYYFPKQVSVFEIVRILHKGEFGLIAKRITLHEGLSSFEMADILALDLQSFSRDAFLNEVAINNYEGTLFPDTYFFSPNTKASDVVLAMRENFARQIKDYEKDILESGKSLEEIIIMASIIEGEANKNIETRRIISGILWKRLRLEMPLQVDAPFKYYNGKHSYTLTKEDLEEEHEYNTYVNKGLPPTAIGNPGIDSIRAAIAPTNTDYLFFMSDQSGNMYYARDFEGHQANRESYLR